MQVYETYNMWEFRYLENRGWFMSHHELNKGEWELVSYYHDVSLADPLKRNPNSKFKLSA